MVAIVRYYLSSFHAARKGTIAKKPYNPILGETFHCYWDLHNSSRNPPNATAKVGVVEGCGLIGGVWFNLLIEYFGEWTCTVCKLQLCHFHSRASVSPSTR